MRKQTLLITGATGALGRPLLEELRANGSVERVFVLARHPETTHFESAVEIVRGDITDSCALGMDGRIAERVCDEITAIVHLAADTRFNAPLDTARRVNVEGVRNLAAFAKRCPRLERFAALSTLHVAGRRAGVIREDELEHDAGFVNAYEQSKYEAELFLRSRMGELPIAVYRSSTILGSARTGEVSKLGAIHHAMRFFYHSLASMIPGQADSPVDLTDVDYTVSAITHLFCERFEAGRTYHICAGADAMSLVELLDLTRQCFLRERPAWRKRAIEMPAIVDLETFELFARSVEEVGEPALRECVGVIKHFAPQLAFPKRFDDSQCARALEGSEVEKPRLAEFYPRIIRHLIATRWGVRPVAELEAASV